MILAIETSDVLCSVAFWDEGNTLLEYNLEMPRQHAILVGSLVEKGLAFFAEEERLIKYTIDDINLVTVAIGPGSFTGLRIGLSFAQGFCSAHQAPIVGVSNHHILAAGRINTEAKIFTIIDARRKEVYLAEHEIVSKSYTKILEHKIVPVSELGKVIPSGSQLIFNRHLNIDSEIIETLFSIPISIIDSARFSAGILAELANEKMKRDGADDLATIEPMYIRSFSGVL